MFIPITTPPAPSREAQELGEQLALFVNEYRQDNPDLSEMEVEQALMLARRQSRTQCGKSLCSTRIMRALAVGVIVLVGLFVAKRSSVGGNPQSIMMITVAIGVAAVVIGLMVVIFAKRR